MSKHKVIRSKMDKTKVLMNDPIICEHIPTTKWFTRNHLKIMLKKYSSIYIKPDKGRQGLGIFRIKAVSNNKWEISNGKNFSKIVDQKQIYQEIRKKLSYEKQYLIQNGIDLATYNHRPFDIRLVMQKPLDRWQLSITCAKIGDHKDSVVTYAKNRSLELPLETTLADIDQDIDPLPVYRELVDLSHQIATMLGNHFPFRILGLDMAIDKNGKLWFIEANTKPDCIGMKKYNDEQSYHKFLVANEFLRNQ
ncbi:YheC/YheD family protein [Desertibacillus haloalkaliphilus]|uniref:YheC/YheD family protein n=1 Tax=Desertibacillus haloalkaliphilus TaxID=1328930 RepID=UPI001C27E0AC|nr:YheC/YheD family protein [Desertibacillus haloalkaliphilus]MBU8907561.1 YheC/YheD family protein [Desertibacillus haloalkaliphilus]